MDPASVKAILGHADMATTERYLHAQRASLLADAATRAFSPVGPASSGGELLDALRRLSPEQREEFLRQAAA